jgi:HlyD family secretion protein
MDAGEPEKSKSKLDVEAVLGLSRPGRTWLSRRAAIGWSVLVALVALGAWLMLTSGGAQPDRSYVTEPIVRGDLKVVVTATGSVQPVNKVDVSSELSGTVRRVLVDFNSKVSAGQPLAELDTDKLQAAVANARAKLAASRAQLVEAAATVEEKRRDYERKRTLAERQVTSVQDVDAAKAAYDRAVAARDSAGASIGVADSDVRLGELNLSKACICSPINGVVLSRNVDPGQTVASSFQAPILFTLAEDLTRMEIQVDVDEADVGKVRADQEAEFSVDAYPDRKFAATVRLVRFASAIVQGVVTYKAILDVDNADLLLRPGMTATAEIVVERVSDAVLAPNAALRFVPASAPREQPGVLARLLRTRMPFQPPARQEAVGRAVWQVRDGVPVAIPVVTGPTDGKFTVLRDGAVSPGAAVIVDSAPARR